MDNPRLVEFLQSLRGQQALIVLVYLFVQTPLTIMELKDYTGLDDDAIRRALKSLAAKNRLVKQNGEHGRQTWLPVTDSFFGLPGFQIPLYTDSEPTTTTTLLISNKECISSSSKEQNPLFTDSVYESYDASFDKNLAALHKAGIHGKVAQELALLPHVSPAFVQAHSESLIFPKETLGLAVLRIRGNEIPASWIKEVDEHKRP